MSDDHLPQGGAPAGVIAFSCIKHETMEEYFQAAERLGFRIIDVNDGNIHNMRQLTHLVAAKDEHSLIKPLCPTFLSALCVNARIVNAQWLIQSDDAGVLLPLENFAVSAHAAEKQHNFSLDESLARGAQAHSQGGILRGRIVYLCDGAANDIPKHSFSNLLSAAGAMEVKTRSGLDNLITDGEGKSVLVVTSGPITQGSKGCGTRCLTMIDFLHVLLHQSIDSIPDEFPVVLRMDNAAAHRTTADRVVAVIVDQYFGHSPELNPLDVSYFDV